MRSGERVMKLNLLVASLVLTTTICGCTHTTDSLVASAKSSVAQVTGGQAHPVAKILCLWEASQGQAPDGTSSKGAAGQILFFAARNPTPIKVDGRIDIYQFDNHGTVEEQSKPIHKFTFDSGAWNAHLTDGVLGPSYNVFIPHMRKTSFQTNCTMKIKFTPADGGMPIYSSMDSVRLDGRRRPEDGAEVSGPKPMAEVIAEGLKELEFEHAVKTPKEPASGLRTLTIHQDGDIAPGRR